jgi:hypothetical protein
MDIFEKFKSRWNDPEFVRSLTDLDREPISSVIERMKRMDRRALWRRRIRWIILKGSLLAILVLACFQQFNKGGWEAPLQSAAFIIVMAAICGLNLVDKAREQYRKPKVSLPIVEFIRDEHRRTDRNIRLDQCASVLLSVAVACVGLYAALFLSGALRIACLTVTGAAVCVLQLLDYRRISQLKQSRDDLAVQVEALD